MPARLASEITPMMPGMCVPLRVRCVYPTHRGETTNRDQWRPKYLSGSAGKPIGRSSACAVARGAAQPRAAMSNASAMDFVRLTRPGFPAGLEVRRRRRRGDVRTRNAGALATRGCADATRFDGRDD